MMQWVVRRLASGGEGEGGDKGVANALRMVFSWVHDVCKAYSRVFRTCKYWHQSVKYPPVYDIARGCESLSQTPLAKPDHHTYSRNHFGTSGPHTARLSSPALFHATGVSLLTRSPSA